VRGGEHITARRRRGSEGDAVRGRRPAPV